jgi:hypothetical protein
VAVALAAVAVALAAVALSSGCCDFLFSALIGRRVLPPADTNLLHQPLDSPLRPLGKYSPRQHPVQSQACVAGMSGHARASGRAALLPAAKQGAVPGYWDQQLDNTALMPRAAPRAPSCLVGAQTLYAGRHRGLGCAGSPRTHCARPPPAQSSGSSTAPCKALNCHTAQRRRVPPRGAARADLVKCRDAPRRPPPPPLVASRYLDAPCVLARHATAAHLPHAGTSGTCGRRQLLDAPYTVPHRHSHTGGASTTG